MAGIAWRGRRVCQCVVDAVADFEVRRSIIRNVFQGGYNGGAGKVRASAGTHDGGGVIDHEQRSQADHLAARSIGLVVNNRDRFEGFDPHAHTFVSGCPHMAAGLRFQDSEYRAGRNGLANRRKDRFPRPDRITTYAAWRRRRIAAAKAGDKLLIAGKEYPNIGAVSVHWVNRARKTKGRSRHVYIVQVWLRKAGTYKGPLDGKFGASTQAALDNFRRKRLKWSAADSVGPLGISSLRALRAAAKSTRIVQEK